MVAKGLDDAGVFGDAGICYEMSERLQEFSWLDVVAWFPTEPVYRERGCHDARFGLLRCNEIGLFWLLCEFQLGL